MAWTIELYDQVKAQTFDITSRVKSFNTTKALNQGVNAFNLFAINIYDLHKKNIVTIKKDGVVWLKGIVINQYDNEQGGIKHTTFECSDNAFIMGRRLVAEVYKATDSTLGLPDRIIKDIITRYLSSSGFTSNHVKESFTSIISGTDLLEFPYIYAQDALERVMEHVNDWYYYIDNDRDFHFFSKFETSSSEGITERKDQSEKSSILRDTLSIETVGDEEFNKIWIVGAKNPADNAITQYFDGTGSQRYFNLSYEAYDLAIQVYTGGVWVDKVVMYESSDDGTADFLLDGTERVMYTPAYKAPFAGSIKATYKPAIQIIDTFENTSSINQVGLYEKILKDTDITSRSSARKIGMAEIRKKSVIKTTLRFQTRRELVLGCLYYVDILADSKDSNGNVVPEVWKLSGNYVVKEISTDVTPADEIHSIVMEEVI